MTTATFLLAMAPLASFAFVTSITPGPNNLLLAASGLKFGIARSAAHLLGINLGFTLLLLCCALGLGALIFAIPSAALVLRIVGSIYLLWLAWQLRGGITAGQSDAGDQPWSVTRAMLFQWVNPKAWMMALSAAAAYGSTLVDQGLLANIVALTAVFALINFPCIAAWLMLGAAMRRWLNHSSTASRIIAGVMIALTLYSAVAVWL